MKLTVAILGSVAGVAVARSGDKDMLAGLNLNISEASLVHLEGLLTEKYGEAEGKEGRATGLFDDLSAMINKTMTPAILTAHDSAQQQLDEFIAAFNLCLAPEAKESGDDGVYPQVEAKLEEHRQCRAKQAAAAIAQDKCYDDLGKERTVAKSVCASVPGTDGAPPPLDASTHVGCKVTPNDYEGWLNSFGHQIDQLKDQHDSAVSGCGNATKLVTDKEPECLAANQTTAGNKSACDNLQLGAEWMACSSDIAVAAACKVYHGCYEAAKSSYLAQNESIVAAQLNRTAQWRSLKRMQCLLKEEDAGASHAGIDSCRNATIDTSHLDLVYPPLPEMTECAELSVTNKGPQPCSDKWMQQYGTLAAPAAPCMPCDTTTTTTWVLVFRQTHPYVWPQNRWSVGTPDDDNYAILDELEKYRFYGQFEFKMLWTSPGFKVDHAPLRPQVWRQASNPITKRGVVGFQPVTYQNYNRNAWGGLQKGLSGKCLLDGSVGKNWWWYSIGAYSIYEGRGYPGPNGYVIPGKVELYVKMGSYPAGDYAWPLVFRQTYPFKFTRDQWSLNSDQPTVANFAILDQLEKYRTTGGKFEFKLVWPYMSTMRDPKQVSGPSHMFQEQIWRQSSNPVTMTTRGVQGYETVSVPYSKNRWGGLENNLGYSALLDGSVGSRNWWFAVGAKDGSGMPGPNGEVVYAVELYVKQHSTLAAPDDHVVTVR